MIFSSISFLYYFLPITIALYFLFPKSLKNIVLLFSSLVFYGWGEPKYLLLMGISILFGYGFGLLVEKYREKKVGKIFCALSVSISFCYILNMQIFLLQILILRQVFIFLFCKLHFLLALVFILFR